MDFIMHEENGAIKLTYIFDKDKNIEFDLGYLFTDLLNIDFDGLIKDLEEKEYEWKLNKDINKIIENYNDFYKMYYNLCKKNLPYPLYLLFFYSMPPTIGDYFEEMKFNIKLFSDLVVFRRQIFESIVTKKDINYETSTWTTRVEFLNGKFIEYIEIPTIDDLTGFALYQIFKNNIKINKCQNIECQKYFIPSSRSDEIYCDNIFKGSRTCKQIGYDNKVNSDEILKVYRKTYKTKNAIKNRNKHNPKAEERWQEWKKEANIKRQLCEDGKISLEEFIEWLNSN